MSPEYAGFAKRLYRSWSFARLFRNPFVDDGSTDDTLGLLRAAHAADPRILALSLSRNFGKEIAITAGIDHVRGAATIIMDADLQHPPELIETFVARWREGYKNVFASVSIQTPIVLCGGY